MAHRSERSGDLTASIATAIVVLVLANSLPAEAKRVSGTFADDLPLMGKQARRDLQIVLPGPQKQRVQRAVDLISAVQLVAHGYLFTVDTDDEYIGVLIRLQSGMNTRKSFETKDDERIVVEYYDKARYVDKWEKELWRGNAAGAISTARVASQQYPDYGPGWTFLGVANAVAGKYDEALISFEKAKKVSFDPQAYHGAALTYIAQGKPAEAEREIKAVVALDPELRQLAEGGIQYFRVSKPLVWGAYRNQLSGKVAGPFIEKAFGGGGKESEYLIQKSPQTPTMKVPERTLEKPPLEEPEKAAPDSPAR